MGGDSGKRITFIPAFVLFAALATRAASGFLWPDPGFIDYLPPIWERKAILSVLALSLGVLALALVAIPPLRPQRRHWVGLFVAVALGFLLYEYRFGHYRML